MAYLVGDSLDLDQAPLLGLVFEGAPPRTTGYIGGAAYFNATSKALNINIGDDTTPNWAHINQMDPDDVSIVITRSPGITDRVKVGYGSPVNIGATNQPGTSLLSARADHIHAHGDQAGGTLHAIANATTPGFLSAEYFIAIRDLPLNYAPIVHTHDIHSLTGLAPDGTIPSDMIPALAISETFPVASQTEMLALSAQKGDVAVRSDISTSFILKDEPASILANWVQLLSPGNVLSVNGQVGNVVLDTDDINEGTLNLYHTPARVLSTVLTGLVTTDGTVVTASDSILIGMGKLQKQISDLVIGSSNAYIRNQNSVIQTAAGRISGTFEALRYYATNAVNQAALTMGATSATADTRWSLYRKGGEAAGDVGSEWALDYHTNAGANKGNAVNISRVTGIANFAQGVTVAGNAVWHAGNLLPFINTPSGTITDWNTIPSEGVLKGTVSATNGPQLTYTTAINFRMNSDANYNTLIASTVTGNWFVRNQNGGVWGNWVPMVLAYTYPASQDFNALNDKSVLYKAIGGSLVNSPAAGAGHIGTQYYYDTNFQAQVDFGSITAGVTTMSVRAKVLGTWDSWRTVWHSGNSNIPTVSWTASNFNAQAAPSSGNYFLKNVSSINRWVFGGTNSESTGNAGYDLTISRYDDAGTFIGPAIFIYRSSGFVGINNTLPITHLDVGGGINGQWYRNIGVTDANIAIASTNVGASGPFTNTTGSTNFPFATGAGFFNDRFGDYTNASAVGSFKLWTSNQSNTDFYLRKLTAVSTWSNWLKIYHDGSDGLLFRDRTNGSAFLTDLNNGNGVGSYAWNSGAATNAPTTNAGVLINIPYNYNGLGQPVSGNSWSHQLAFPQIGGNGDMYYRFYNGTTFSTWTKFWHSNNSNISTVDWVARTLISDRAPGTGSLVMRNGSGVNMWTIYGINAQSSGNVGYDFAILRNDDTGAGLTNAMCIKRSTGFVGVGLNLPIYELDVAGRIGLRGEVLVHKAGTATGNPNAEFVDVIWNSSSTTIGLLVGSIGTNAAYKTLSLYGHNGTTTKVYAAFGDGTTTITGDLSITTRTGTISTLAGFTSAGKFVEVPLTNWLRNYAYGDGTLTDWATITTDGVYHGGLSTPNSPGANYFNGINITGLGAANYNNLIGADVNSQSWWVRMQSAGVWGSWKMLYDTGNSNLLTVDWNCRNLQVAYATIAALDINFSTAGVQSKTITGNTTFTMSNNSNGKGVQVAITCSGGTFTIAITGVTWKGNPTLSLATGEVGVVSLIVINGVTYGTFLK